MDHYRLSAQRLYLSFTLHFHITQCVGYTSSELAVKRDFAKITASMFLALRTFFPRSSFLGREGDAMGTLTKLHWLCNFNWAQIELDSSCYHYTSSKILSGGGAFERIIVEFTWTFRNLYVISRWQPQTIISIIDYSSLLRYWKDENLIRDYLPYNLALRPVKLLRREFSPRSITRIVSKCPLWETILVKLLGEF